MTKTHTRAANRLLAPWVLRLGCVAGLVGLGAAPVQATPPAAGAAAPSAPAPSAPAPFADPLLQLLHERGVVHAASTALQPALAMAEQARDRAAEAVVAAMAFLDMPYARGGTHPEAGFDCSGFTRHVFQNTLGLLLPRSADQQAQASSVQQVSADELKPGDLVFFNTLRKAYSHVGIYVGEGRFVHAPRTGGAVRLESMRKSYWVQRFDGARRVLFPSPHSPSAARPAP